MKKSLLLLALLTFGCSKKPVDMDEVLFDRADRWITNSNYSSFFFYNIKVYNGPAFTKHSNGEKKEKGEIKNGYKSGSGQDGIKMVISATQAPIGLGRNMVVGLAGIKTARRNMKVIIIKASK